MVNEFSVLSDLNNLMNFCVWNRPHHPQMVVIELLGYDKERGRETELNWTGEDGLRRLLTDIKLTHCNTVVFVGGDYEHDPQNYKNLKNASELCRNTGIFLGIVTYGTLLDLSRDLFDYVEIKVPAVEAKGWHEVVGIQPPADSRTKWFYPWDHKGTSAILVGRTTPDAILPEGREVREIYSQIGKGTFGPYNHVRIGSSDFILEEKEREFDKCHFQWFRPFIDSRGDIYACPEAADSGAIGNIRYQRFNIWWTEKKKILALSDCERTKEKQGCRYAKQNKILHYCLQRGPFS